MGRYVLEEDKNVYKSIEKCDNVNSPSHYADKQIEVIDYMYDTLSKDEFIGYCIGNVIKYTSRWRKKNGKEDLKKALTYLKWAVQASDDVEKLTK